jgi:glutaredoxin
MITIVLYTTAGCHLCDLADAILQELSNNYDMRINYNEIGDDDELVERYGTTIPVVKFIDDSELLWPFSPQDIERKIEQLHA